MSDSGKHSVTFSKPSVAEIKRHKMQKVNFDHPTWCIFASKFIWGLDKTGYKCNVCGIVCSRPKISLCKKTVCLGSSYQNEAFVSVNVEKMSKVFTIYLPMGAKKSMVMDPNVQLKDILIKICRERAIPMEEYYPQDKNGKVVAMSTLLGQILDGEITFTKKDEKTDMSLIPPLIEALERELAARNEQDGQFGSNSRKSKKYIIDGSKSEKPSKDSPSPSHSRQSISPSLSTKDVLQSKEVEKEPPKEEKILEVYSLDEELGNGAFSVVYSSRHRRTGQVVAIKVLEKYKDELAQQQKLMREISIHKNLSHDNIVKFFQVAEDDEHYFVVMELVVGGELFEQVCEQKYFYEKEASPLICQILQGLIYLHDRGIAHRDIKPENLLFADKSKKTIKIADFGEAKTFYDNQLSTYCGTPDYMCPEIIKSEVYGKEVDMWALGVTTFVLLGGYAPFEGENDNEVFAAILSLNYKYITPEWNHIGQVGRDFIDALLKVDPAKRLTARQAIQHPFIVNFTPAEMRVLPVIDLGEKSFKENRRQVLLDFIEKFLGILKTRMPTRSVPADKILFGELMYLKQLVSHSKLSDHSPMELNVFNQTWTRLHEIYPFMYS